jgi:hypothetical protein
MTLNKKDVEKTNGRDSERDVASVANALRLEIIGDPRLDN